MMTYALIPLLPFAAFLILGIFGHWIKDKAHLVAVPAVVVSWLLALMVFFDVAGGHQTSFPLYTWLTSGLLDIHIGRISRGLRESFACRQGIHSHDGGQRPRQEPDRHVRFPSRGRDPYICDVDRNIVGPAVKAVVAAKGKLPAVVDDIRRVLDDKSVHAIVVATPIHWHVPALLLAWEYGYPCGENNQRVLNACAYQGHCGVASLPDYLFYYGASPYDAQLLDRYRGILRQAVDTGDWSAIAIDRSNRSPNLPSYPYPGPMGGR